VGNPKSSTPTAAEALIAYFRWQRREESKDDKLFADWQEKTIARDDPECDALIRALERDWGGGEGR